MTKSRPRRLLAAIAAAILAAGCGSTVKESSVEGVASYERGKESYDQKDYTDAIADLKAYVQQFPGTDNTDDALYFLGMSYFQIKDFVLAAGQFDRLLRDFPASSRQPGALFQLARCDDLQSHPAALDQTETLRAITRYKQFLDLYPENEHAADARKRLAALNDRQAQKQFLNGRLYVRLKQYDAAIFYLSGVVTTYPTSQWSGQSDLLLATVYLKRGQTNEAMEALRQVEETESSSYVKRQASDWLRELQKSAKPQ